MRSLDELLDEIAEFELDPLADAESLLPESGAGELYGESAPESEGVLAGAHWLSS